MSDLSETESVNYGGGSLLIAWQLKDKNVLIVGGGEVASQRIESILTADARITLLSPERGLHPRTKRFIESRPDRITYYDRRFTGPNEIHKMDMVLTALDDVNRSREICEMCRKARVPVNAADIPDSCDFYFGSQIRDGPLQIMISTNGNGPRMASLIKAKLQKGLTGLEGEAITKIGELRTQLKERAPGVGGAVGRKRMKWMTNLCNAWEMEDFTLLDDTMTRKLLDEGWEKNRVPSFEEVGGKRRARKKASPGPSQPSIFIPSALGFVAGAICTLLYVVARRR
ncbi:putative NAD(P)-binding-domain-containing protein [Infundibulicybe gibba]|nr:putative NAD(P)-binding-domain-containing protein [Infundibulicybe gibba]